MNDRPISELHVEMLFAAILASTGMGTLLWGVGESLNFVSTGHFTGTSIASGATMLLRLPLHADQPAAAWPAAHRPDFQPLLFLAGVVLAIGLVLLILRALAPGIGRLRGRSKKPHSAKWARFMDLRNLVVAAPTAGRLTLGKTGAKLIAGEPRASVVVFGPTQTGKTTGLVIPAIVEWQGPVLATSVKTDLMDHTIAARRKNGKVFVYDPAQVVENHKRHSWTPLRRSKTFDGAQQTAKALVGAAKQSMGGAKEGDFWYTSAESLLAPYLYAAVLAGKDIETVVQWIDRQEEDEVTAALLQDPQDMALSTANGIWESGPEQRSSIFTTARTILIAYRNMKVLDTARRSEITPDALLDGGAHTAYLCAPIHEQENLRPLYATLVKELINSVYEHATRTGEPLDPPLLVVLDEAANIAPIEDLNEIASTAAGVGIQLVTVFQDFAQVRQRWNIEKAQTIVSNHRAKMVLSGIADQHTLEWVSRVTGDQEFHQVSFTDGRHNKSTTDSTTYRALTPANVVRELKTDTALLIYGNLPPAKIDLRPWYRDRKLKQRIEDAKANDPIRIDPTTGEVLDSNADFDRLPDVLADANHDAAANSRQDVLVGAAANDVTVTQVYRPWRTDPR